MKRVRLLLVGGVLVAAVSPVLRAPSGHAAVQHRHVVRHHTPGRKPVRHPAHHAASATTPTVRLGGADAWSAYDYKGKSGLVCYLIGQPRKAAPAGLKRNHPMAMITQRPGEKIYDVVSFMEGYPLKTGSDVTVSIDGKPFSMFTDGDSAWSRTSATDKAIVEAMAKGRTAIVKGVPKKGAATSDSYSLAGFSKALDLANKACKIKP